MKKFFILSIFLFISILSFTQKKYVSLQGKITDSKTGTPLQGASVLLIDFKLGASTDSLGNFVITEIPSGHSIIEVSYLGYRTIVDHIDIRENTIRNFKLSASVIENEAIIVTGTGIATTLKKTPIPVLRMNKEQLLSTSSSNIIDALRNQPGISQISTGPAISKPIIRGLGYNRLVVINDNVRQEGQQWGDEHGIEIDENSVSRIEIVKGPASLIYGSDALAGVINIITTSPMPENKISGTLLSGYGTNNHQSSFFANIGGNARGFGWNIWGDSRSAGDYKNKYDNYVWNSKFNEKNIGGNVGYKWNKGFSHLIFSRFDQTTGLVEGDRDSTGKFIRSLPNGEEGYPSASDFRSTNPQTPYQHILHTKIISDNSFNVGKGKFTFTVGFQRNQRREFGDPDQPGMAQLHFDLQTINYTTSFQFPERNGWHSSVGVSGMKQQNKNRGEEVLIPEYSLFDAGAYLYSQKTIGKSTFSGGFRYDNRQLNSHSFFEGSEQKFSAFKKDFSNISGSAGISYAATQNIVLKLNVARGFRAPSIPELASNGAHEGTNRYEYGNTDLKSETTWQGDAGIEINSEHLSVKANAFYNHISNFIFYSKLAGVNTPDSLVASNGDFIPAYKFSQRTANLAGFEFVTDLHPHPLDWLHWENTFSYVRGKFISPLENNINVPFIPATHWSSELRTDIFKKNKVLQDFNIFLEADYTFAQKNPFTAFETETATPAYMLLNAGITTSFSIHKQKLFSVYLLANNLTDVAYQSHLSRLKYAAVNEATGRQGVFNTGRNFILRLRIPFSFSVKK